MSLPENSLRLEAAQRILTLDCHATDSALAPCGRSAASPPGAWRDSLMSARVVDDAIYSKALAAVLKPLVCSSDTDAVYIVRGSGYQSRLPAAGPAASGLIDGLLNKDSTNCPVAAEVTDAERAKLLQIKQEAEEEGKLGR
jgi:hypothetical protein